MIVSYRDKITKALAEGGKIKGIPADIVDRAVESLAMIRAAETLEDLRTPPGNMLEALGGDRKGQHSIRINRQWRVCFRWEDDGAHDVEVVDYH